MANDLYWVSALTYAVVLLIIVFNDIRINKNPNEIDRGFRKLTTWVVFFCLQDMLWGLCEAGILEGDRQFFIASSFFHISTVITTFFWLQYVLTYLGENAKKKAILLTIDGIVIVFEVVLIIINIFTPTMFTIQNGVYKPEYLRPLTFVNQYMVYLAIGIATLITAVRKKGAETKRYITVFFFALAPILMGIFQLLFPDAPFYSLGYFLGCFIVHIFIVSKDREVAAKGTVLHSIADTYFSMHIIHMEDGSVEKLLEPESITKMMGDAVKAQDMLERAFVGSACEEHQEIVKEFADLSTLSERMKESKTITCEFVGIDFGWTRASFISVEKQGGIQKQVMLVTQIIDSEKRKQMELLFQSNNDELTGLYNRRAFEADVLENKDSEIPKDFVFISLDVNELKVINDSQGHAAGDELLIGASDCMKKCFGDYGKIYRTGGDEFNAIIYADHEKLEEIKKNFEEAVASWSGEIVESLSVSSGYVALDEIACATIHDISVLADKRMYEAKSNYYRKKGIDRRGQKDAYSALCLVYYKILKINLSKDSFQIIHMDFSEQNEAMGYSNTLSAWLSDFCRSGRVHPDDMNAFLARTEASYLRDYFAEHNSSLSFGYRRLCGGTYRNAVMEIRPSNEYEADHSSLYLYVRIEEEE